MSEMHRYWSLGFIKEFVRRLNESDEFLKAARRFNNTIELVCLDTPDGRDIAALYKIDKGKVTVSTEEEPAPSTIRERYFDGKAILARATATYEVWGKLDRGEISVVSAMASPDYTVEGPMMKIMMSLPVFTALNQVSSATDKTY